MVIQEFFPSLSVADNEDPEQLADLREEVVDRFGLIPRETEALLTFIEHSRPQKRANKKTRPARGLRVPGPQSRPRYLCRLTPDQRLLVALDEHVEQAELFQRIEAVLGFLSSFP